MGGDDTSLDDAGRCRRKPRGLQRHGHRRRRQRGPGRVGDDCEQHESFRARGPGHGPGHGNRFAIPGGSGGQPCTEYAVRLALEWLARHQSSEGNWSLKTISQRCKDGTCSGPGNVDADAAATRHGTVAVSRPRRNAQDPASTGWSSPTACCGSCGIRSPTAICRPGSAQQMYTHALATIALCEAYGMTGDKNVGMAAQAAVQFIEAAQNARPAAGAIIPATRATPRSSAGKSWRLKSARWPA